MRMSDYYKSRRKGDEEALYGVNKPKRQKKQKKDPAEKVKDLSLDEIFFVLTRSGAETFVKMVENSTERIIQDSVEKALAGGALEEMVDRVITERLKEVATGIERGFQAGVEDKLTQIIQPTVTVNAPKNEEVKAQVEQVQEEDKTTREKVELEENLYSRWSPQELEYMVTTLMNQVALGKTMGQAQEYVAEQLGRTPQAVGYQFSKVRDEYQEEYQQAKIQRRKARKRV